jgi:alkanesulfonate monooxygenase SsuD/methylene tetrahydromethanopterin reductase-like flavin-dependent oxidoreductase (luciferase family)
MSTRGIWPCQVHCRFSDCGPVIRTCCPVPPAAAAYPYTDAEREAIQTRQAHQVVGDPQTVLRGLIDLLERTAADELMLTTIVHDHADRLRSYELVAALRGSPVLSAEGPSRP